MEPYFAALQSAGAKALEFVSKPEFWDHYMVHLIYCFLLLVLFYFNPRKSQSKIDLFMRAYKDSFYHEEKIKRKISCCNLVYTVCKNAILVCVVVGFVFSFMDLPGSDTFQRLVSMDETIFGPPEQSDGRLGQVLGVFQKGCIVGYHLMSEHKINLYCKALVVLLVLGVLLRRCKVNFEAKNLIQLEQIESDKDVFMQRFLEILGKDFRKSLTSFLIQKNKAKLKQGRQLLGEKAKLEKEVQALQTSLQKQGELKRLYVDFAQEIMDFQWCEVCYDGEEIDTISEMFSGVKEREVQRSLKALSGELGPGDDFPQGEADSPDAKAPEKEESPAGQSGAEGELETAGEGAGEGEQESRSGQAEDSEKKEEAGEGPQTATEKPPANAQSCEDSGKQAPAEREHECEPEEELKDFQKLSSIDRKTRTGWNLVKRKMLQKKRGERRCAENCLVMFLLLCNRLGASFQFLDLAE